MDEEKEEKRKRYPEIYATHRKCQQQERRRADLDDHDRSISDIKDQNTVGIGQPYQKTTLRPALRSTQPTGISKQHKRGTKLETKGELKELPEPSRRNGRMRQGENIITSNRQTKEETREKRKEGKGIRR